MAIYAILMPTPQPQLAEEIKRIYPFDHLSISDTQWLVSSAETIGEVAARVNVYNPNDPVRVPSGNAVLLSVTSYTGRASPNIWNWLRGPTFSERMRRSQSRRWSSVRRRGDLKFKGVTRLFKLAAERNGNCYILCHREMQTALNGRGAE
jgi:hypothetical protein